MNKRTVMRFFLILACTAVTLIGCASIPKPESANDSLVVGQLVLDFPDGYFNLPSRTFQSYVGLHFIDPATRTGFWCGTSDGYFQFHSKGRPALMLERLVFSNREGNGEYHMSDSIRQSFPIQPGKVVYLGRVTVRYSKPLVTNRVAMGQSSIQEGIDPDQDLGTFLLQELKNEKYWQYQRSYQQSWDLVTLHDYLKKKDPHSPWLNYEVIQQSLGEPAG